MQHFFAIQVRLKTANLLGHNITVVMEQCVTFPLKRQQQNGLIVRIQLLYELIQRLCTEREMERDQFEF